MRRMLPTSAFKNFLGRILLLVVLASGLACETEEAPDCLRSAGSLVRKEFKTEPFEELIVYDKIQLFIRQGSKHRVVIETGEHLIKEVSAEVSNNRLRIKNGNTCNLFREYELTKVYVTVPNLSWLQNAGDRTIESIGVLNFPDIWLRSFNQEKVDEIYTNGDFKLELASDRIRITGDDFSNFFLSGSTGYLDAYFASGDGRLEAAGLIAGTVEIQHRGTNKLIVNPQQVLKGEIRSTGDVISVNRPAQIRVETFYTGRLYFQEP